MKIGKLSKENVRSVWTHEAIDFTPWLAEKENLDLLASELGIELALKETEAKLDQSNYSVDILCEDPMTEEITIIENQFEKSDHKHLGQLITYAAGLDASRIIWVLEEVREEHRAAIDWLNEHTEGKDFFIVQLEVWKISDSDPAPKFNVISKPNEWSRDVKEKEKQIGLSPNQSVWLEYWIAFKKDCEIKHPKWRMRKPEPTSYYHFRPDNQLKDIGLSFGTDSRGLSVYLWLKDENGEKPLYDHLLSHKAEIEDNLKYSLTWNDHSDNKRQTKSSSIGLRKEIDTIDQGAWKDHRDWMQEMVVKFVEAFGPYFAEFEKQKVDKKN